MKEKIKKLFPRNINMLNVDQLVFTHYRGVVEVYISVMFSC